LLIFLGFCGFKQLPVLVVLAARIRSFIEIEEFMMNISVFASLKVPSIALKAYSLARVVVIIVIVVVRILALLVINMVVSIVIFVLYRGLIAIVLVIVVGILTGFVINMIVPIIILVLHLRNVPTICIVMVVIMRRLMSDMTFSIIVLIFNMRMIAFLVIMTVTDSILLLIAVSGFLFVGFACILSVLFSIVFTSLPFGLPAVFSGLLSIIFVVFAPFIFVSFAVRFGIFAVFF
jgi:hypothetical protein